MIGTTINIGSVVFLNQNTIILFTLPHHYVGAGFSTKGSVDCLLGYNGSNTPQTCWVLVFWCWAMPIQINSYAIADTCKTIINFVECTWKPLKKLQFMTLVTYILNTNNFVYFITSSFPIYFYIISKSMSIRILSPFSTVPVPTILLLILSDIDKHH